MWWRDNREERCLLTQTRRLLADKLTLTELLC